jgi:Ran-binding protein 9/10
LLLVRENVANNTKGIRSAILEGDIDKALKHTDVYYPSVLRDNEKIYFKLRCRKFIEMIRRCNEIQNNLTSSPTQRSAANGHSSAPDEYDIFDHHMELDEQFNKEWNADRMDTEQDSASYPHEEAEYNKLMQETIKYGQELKSDFASDSRREIKKALEDTFALIAYPDARMSSLAPLLEESGRVPVAEELNSAILGKWIACLTCGFGADAFLQCRLVRARVRRWRDWCSRRRRWWRSWRRMEGRVRLLMCKGILCR